MTTYMQRSEPDTQPANRTGHATRLRGLAVLGAGILTLTVLTGCQVGPPVDPGAPVSSEQPGGASDDDSNNSPDGTPVDDAATGVPEGLPEGLPSMGLPFYMPSQLVAVTSIDDPWVLEFVTDASLDAVNSSIELQFSETNGWTNITDEPAPDHTITHGVKDGYTLTIAVAPERDDPNKTSLFYTLRKQ